MCTMMRFEAYMLASWDISYSWVTLAKLIDVRTCM